MKNNLRTHDTIQKIVISQEDDYTAGCLLDYNYSKDYYNMIALDLRKQQTLDTDPNAIQKITFTGNVAQNQIGNTTMFFIIEVLKETVLAFSSRTVSVLWF